MKGNVLFVFMSFLLLICYGALCYYHISSMTSDLGTANDHDEYGLFPKSLRDREDVSGKLLLEDLF